jgi:predicted metal-dependent hydrolase
MKSEGDTKVFLQALIQVAAACVHLARGNAAPGVRLLTLADEKLARFANAFGGINTDFLRKEIRQAAERVGRGDAPGEVAKALQM